MYQECEKYGCVEIQEFPKDIEKYYPGEYFAYRPPNTGGTWRDFIDSRRLRYALTMESLVGRIVESFSKNLTYAEWIKIMGINFDARILDVGCGAGKFLFQLRHGGFKDLTGIDPFVEKDFFYENGVKVFKIDLKEFSSNSNEKFDSIIFNNSFEHMFYPLEVLGQAINILGDNDWIVIVTPVADSEEWAKYRENWANLDAPRHFFLHTSKSLQILCDSLKLVMHKTFVFWKRRITGQKRALQEEYSTYFPKK